MNPLHRLTGRQLDVLHLLAEGFDNGEIGERLFLGKQGVKYHVAAVYRTLGVRNRVEAAVTYHVWCAE